MIEIRRIVWHPDHVLDVVDDLSRKSTERAGERLLADAAGRVPHNTGELEHSGVVSEIDDGVVVGWTAPHAVFVHGRGRALGGRDAHWAESTLEADAGAVGDEIAQTFRSGWPNG